MQGNVDVARIIAGDTIRAAHQELSGDATVAACLDTLRGPEGDLMVQAVMADYLAAGAATGREGPFSGRESLNTRCVSSEATQVSAQGLKQALDEQLRAYLTLTPEQKQAFRTELEAAAAQVAP